MMILKANGRPAVASCTHEAAFGLLPQAVKSVRVSLETASDW